MQYRGQACDVQEVKMDKKQKVRFRLPEDFYLPEKAEGWLEEKAAEGLFLQSLGRKWAVFYKRGAGGGCVYACPHGPG